MMFKEKYSSSAIDIFLVLAQRLLVLLFFFLFIKGFSLHQWVCMRDGGGYLNIAKGFLSHSFASVPREDTQYFIGYPALLSSFLFFMKPWMAVMALQFLSLLGCVLLASNLFKNRQLTQGLLLCMPPLVLFTSMNMSESLLLLLYFAALSAYFCNRFKACALFLGIAFITRPQFIFSVFLVLAVDLLLKRKTKPIILLTVTCACFITAMFLFNHLAFGDSLHNFHLYQAHEQSKGFFALPLVGFAHSLGDSSIRWVNRLYVFIAVSFTAIGLFLLICRLSKKSEPESLKVFFWTGLLQLFFLLSLNSRWAFLELPRYLIGIFPSALLGYEPFFPKSRLWIWLGALGSIIFAVYAEAAGNRYAY